MQKPPKIKFLMILLIVSGIVLIGTLLSLVYARQLEEAFGGNSGTIGIRIAVLIVTFAAFLSSTVFSFLVYNHNRTVSKINDDTNKRSELFRNLQFTSTNYSIIEFMDRMLIYTESSRYVDKFIKNRDGSFHMFESSINENDVFNHPDKYQYISVKIPFKVVEGKQISKITFNRLKYERDNVNYEFIPPAEHEDTRAYLLYNEYTKRNNIIVNLVVKKDSNFFDPKSINVFSKIKISLNITSLLSVTVKGTSELYFINPEQIEGDGTNTYRINSSNFVIKGMPFIDENFDDAN